MTAFAPSPFHTKQVPFTNKSKRKNLCRCQPSPKASLQNFIPLAADIATAIGPIGSSTYVGPSITEFAAALAGGTVGVMGTLICLEVVMKRARERKQCPYCRGTGRLPCGVCCTIGGVPFRGAKGGEKDCEECGKVGFLMCNHCEGSGRLIPIEYERALRAQYEDYIYTSFDDDYFGVSDGPPYL